ncbi:MAG: hypothetical protein LBS21_00940 [Clostridiales bacterium]|nr:hypothetical protein [Clostridiales bacterium]
MGWYREALALVPENYGFRRGGLFYLAGNRIEDKARYEKGFIIGGKPRQRKMYNAIKIIIFEGRKKYE